MTGKAYFHSPRSADYALLGAALSHQCDDSQITLFWLCREGRAALQARAMGRWNPVMLGSGVTYHGERLRDGSKREMAGKRRMHAGTSKAADALT
ncbi:MAG: hypothetical protein ACYCO9_13280 [Streptosporangiaceae bacterium]